jgi:hypothetical protein
VPPSTVIRPDRSLRDAAITTDQSDRLQGCRSQFSRSRRPSFACDTRPRGHSSSPHRQHGGSPFSQHTAMSATNRMAR